MNAKMKSPAAGRTPSRRAKDELLASNTINTQEITTQSTTGPYAALKLRHIYGFPPHIARLPDWVGRSLQ